MKMYKKGIAWILALMLALGIAPGVFAAEEENGNSAAQPKYYAENPEAVDNGNLYMNKQLTVKEDGTGVITLESYVKGSVATSSKPTDIVLVLDQSGSMDDPMGDQGSEKKIDMLKSAATAFVKQIREDNMNLQGDQKHRIAIVGFGSEKGNGNNSEILTLKGKNSKYGGGKSERIGKKYQDLSNADYQNALVNSDNTIVDNAISALAAKGATRTDLGMTMAQKVLAQNPDTTRNKVVVMFTDGVPTSSDSFDNGVANKTINTSKTIKDSKASVYTVGLFDKAPNTDVDNFMNYVSSNYPEASSMKEAGDKAEGSNYYRVAKDANSLKDIFESISQEVQNTTLNETSIVQDVLSQYVDADPKGEITCQVSTYDGTGFGTPAEAPEKVKATLDGKKISVTGFDFKPVIAGKEGGQKLIIQIPVMINAQAVESATGTMPSNVEADSGIYHENTKVGTFNTPKLVTLTAEGGQWPYDGNSHPATAAVKGGEGYTIQYSTNGEDWSETAPSVTNVKDGPLTVYARALKDGNAVVYAEPVTLKISPKLITIKVNNAEKSYGDKDPTFTGSIEGKLVSANDLGTISYKRTNEAEAVGTYRDVLTADYTENSNYKVTIENGDFMIKPAQSPETAVLTLSGGEWTYDGDAHPATAQVTGAEGYTILYSTDEENWTETAPSVKDVDDGTVTVYARAKKEGYTDLETVETTLKINPRPVTLTSGSADKIYDGTALTKNEVTAGTAEQEGFVKNEGFTYSTSGSQTVVGSSDNDFTYTLKANTKARNYTIEKATGTLTVNPAPLTVKADDKVKHQGEDNPQLTGTITGFVNGETSDVLKGDVQYSTTAEKDSPVGTYPIKAGGTLKAQNYEIQYVDGTLTVTEKGAIIDNDPTQDQTAQTGDDFQIWLIAGIALLALAGAGTVIFTRRRKAD